MTRDNRTMLQRYLKRTRYWIKHSRIAKKANFQYAFELNIAAAERALTTCQTYLDLLQHEILEQRRLTLIKETDANT